ncbi:MAG: beta-galactosidase trimerization domain-containing protein, partial [Succinivibrio sp.]|nr:beta-galactosidase trimerization domain-containing protein [Succinivibrio sp.]
MSIGFDALFGVHQHTMVIRNQRAEVLAGNLANADTPGYKARDLDFNVAFKQAAHIVDEDPKALVKQYPLIIAPSLYSAPIELIDSLRKYVENGGNLVLGFKSLVADEELKIYSDALPYNMTDLIGGSYDQFTRPVDT